MILKLHDVFDSSKLVIIVTNELVAYPSRTANGYTSVQTPAAIIGVRESGEEIAAQIEAQANGYQPVPAPQTGT